MRVLVALLLCVTGCTADPQRRATVTVFAAASLSKAFQAEAKLFETAHPDLRLTFSFAGSQSLVAQIDQGAPADVLATADVATIEKVRGRLTAAPVIFAHNQLAIVTARGNPLHISGLSDLKRVRVVLAGPSVPVGKASAKALAAAGVVVKPVSFEEAVTGVVGKVRLGEADAGIAYVTDLVASGGQLDGIPLPGTRTDLAVAALNDRQAARAFLEFLLTDDGQATLRSFGFR